uniref:Hermansky-Pudlak syndrome 4, isoform A n=1 Tax=Drosophila melanogaster TaxID=7227 RepID=A1ZAX8_DROME|nr:Hermansky-Pudlak syndrome 4, isoform A [Drosophila melanogaster]AAF57814.1 Hermansky-Pudlak syndrome 4, isoform A [Drosophila melanogaster]|eukprot:NP_611246.1 Hermansky-Pudlak syndrome 4, isoform A [Drosophila melanogaster]
MFRDWRKTKHKRWQKVQQKQQTSILTERETMIVFVYDTECLTDEADDPISAVLYFHPSWVSDSQKVALCGQLMGTSYFLKDCFFNPRILALQNGKFVLKEFGRFILAIGTDRNIGDQLLEHRADLLSSLLKFFHRDVQTLYAQYAAPPALNRRNLSEKLYHIFETYLPMLQRNGNTFQNVPRLRMPKTASHIFLEAIQTLQSCQQTKGILGGAILYHNKVVASQLSDMVTKHLVLTDPLHIRTAAEQVTNHPEFHIPNGVQMLVVYLEHMQYRQLAGEAQRAQNLQMNTAQLTQNGMPFQYAKRKIKRDKSLIFTHIPEEEHAPEQQGAVEQLPPARPKSMRPTHLPLRIKSMQSKELPESGIASINFDETDSYPQFIGRTSVCNTPMTENKVLPVANVMSICANPEDEGKEEDIHNSNGKTHSRRNSLKVDVEKFFQNFISNPNKQLTRRKSSADLQDALRAISKKLNNFTHGLKTDVNRNGSGNGDVSSDSPDFIEDDDKITSRTISDPTYPVFNTNGQQISRSLFQQFLDQYRKLWGVASEQAHEDAELAALVAEFQEFNAEIQKLDEHMRQQAAEASSADRNLNVSAAKTPLDKRSMTLPLKSAGESTFGERASGRSGAGGVPLTPLMAKLSVLALSETTPIEIQTPLTTSKVFPRRSSLKCEDAVDALAALTTAPAQPPGPIQPDGLQRTELYICGQQNMTLLLLMEEGTCQQQQVVQKMFDICVAKFPHMESQLNQTLNVNVEGDNRDGSNYSFMCVDSKWDVLQRNGPWNPLELNILESMHSIHSSGHHLTDLILRSNDSVYYGHKNGRTEFFYKEPTHQINGIPPPSDPIGNIQSRAKSRLERDHSYMLF